MKMLKSFQSFQSDETLSHTPVLLKEVIEGLNIKPNGTYVDLTLGRAGHSKAILSRIPVGLLIAVDQDQDAINEATPKLEKVGHRFVVKSANFRNIEEILASLEIDKVDGVLMDLGVSSPQFDDIDRGFSYRFDSRLDMRMNQTQSLSAYEVINNYSLKDLTRIIRDYGDEKYAYSIAKNIIKTRETSPIVTTFDLVGVIKRSKPAKELSKAGHPAKKTFQAIRIEVNDELNALKDALNGSIKHLNIGGRLAVITFHSGEDKIVKDIFHKNATIEGNRYNVGLSKEEMMGPMYRLVNRKVITATDEELLRNHRASSAKLRIIEKIR